jgi:putative flippase GtrA
MTEGVSAARPHRLGALRQISIFCAVGAAAFMTHFGVVIAVVPLGLHPLIANVVGFLCAFGVSFIGHNHWTFPGPHDRDRARALHRFFTVAVSSFAINETLLWLMLLLTRLPYQLALLIVLVIVAALTLLLSKYWAFADD